MLNVYRQAQAIVFVSDGTVEANTKIDRAFSALAVQEQNADAPLVNRIQLIYNRFSSQSGRVLDMPGVKTLGGAPRYSGGGTQQIINQLAKMAIFDGLL
ncbi:MAG: hypothetical protein LUH51_04155 [Firmicutes bacterium]|nr:hypothetical protein [Bacillota bacterium]